MDAPIIAEIDGSDPELADQLRAVGLPTMISPNRDAASSALEAGGTA